MVSEANGSSQHYHELLMQSKDGIIQFDCQGIIKLWNPSARSITGYGFDEVENRVFWDIINIESDNTFTKDRNMGLIIKNICGDFLKSPGEWQSKILDLKLTRKDGRISYVQLIMFPILCSSRDSAAPAVFCGILHDITEKKQIELKLYEEKMMLVALIENLPIMVDAFDRDGNFIIWNKECERITGYSNREIVGKPVAESLALLYPDPDYLASITAEWAVRGNNFRNWEIELTCKNGQKKVIAWTNIGEHIKIPGITSWAVGIDVTQKKN